MDYGERTIAVTFSVSLVDTGIGDDTDVGSVTLVLHLSLCNPSSSLAVFGPVFTVAEVEAVVRSSCLSS